MSKQPRRLMQIDDLLRETAMALEQCLEYIDATYCGRQTDEDIDRWRMDVMENAGDMLSCYRHKDYEIVAGNVEWPEGSLGWEAQVAAEMADEVLAEQPLDQFKPWDEINESVNREAITPAET